MTTPTKDRRRDERRTGWEREQFPLDTRPGIVRCERRVKPDRRLNSIASRWYELGEAS